MHFCTFTALTKVYNKLTARRFDHELKKGKQINETNNNNNNNPLAPIRFDPISIGWAAIILLIKCEWKSNGKPFVKHTKHTVCLHSAYYSFVCNGPMPRYHNVWPNLCNTCIHKLHRFWGLFFNTHIQIMHVTFLCVSATVYNFHSQLCETAVKMTLVSRFIYLFISFSNLSFFCVFVK